MVVRFKFGVSLLSTPENADHAASQSRRCKPTEQSKSGLWWKSPSSILETPPIINSIRLIAKYGKSPYSKNQIRKISVFKGQTSPRLCVVELLAIAKKN
jgi:hypothetical protein